MSFSESDLSAYHYLPAYTAEPRKGYERRLHIHGSPPSIPDPQREWRGQFVKRSKSGGITFKISNQKPNAPLPVYYGGLDNPIRGCVDLAKTENVTSVELKECLVCPSPRPNLLIRNGFISDNRALRYLHSFDIQLEGRLLLREVAAGGASTTELCTQRITLWTREHLLVDSATHQGCQISLPFALNLPTKFSDEHGTHVSGLSLLWPAFSVRLTSVT